MVKRSILLWGLCFLITFSALQKVFCSSNEPKYPVSSIPGTLIQNADLVVREYTMNMEVKSLSTMLTKVHVVYTIMRENALAEANLELTYNSFRKIKSITSTCYDAAGYEIDHAVSKNTIDESAVPDFELFSETRVKKLKITGFSYPFTVEYTYEIEDHKMIGFPEWQPQENFRVSVEHSELTVKAEDDFLPRFKEVNIPQPSHVIKEKGFTTVSYTFLNIPAVVKERYCIPIEESVPIVYIAPNIYQTLGETYDFRSWKSIGLWDYSLNKDRDVLPDKTRNQVLELIKDKKTNLEKIKAIYGFMQQNTRYVCVVLGIGGLQTIEASEVAQKGYGDCKGLVNYTKALLSVAGITSYAVIVKAGDDENDILTDFPSNQFNHVILCVPQEKDTIWLECTNQSIPFGYLGSFTDNRHVLVITSEGGVLLKTPEYPRFGNTLNRRSVIYLDTNGNATVNITTKYRGLWFEKALRMENRSVKDMKDIFSERINASSATINKISYTYKKDEEPEALEEVNLSVRSYASITGNRFFLPFNLFVNTKAELNDLSSRKSPVFFRKGSIAIDTIEVHLPAGYKIEATPMLIDESTQFGHYKVTVTNNPDVLLYTRLNEQNQGRFEPETFPELSTYFQKIARADKNNAVLIKK